MRGRRSTIWRRRLIARRSAVAGVVLCAALVLCGLPARALTPFDPDRLAARTVVAAERGDGVFYYAFDAPGIDAPSAAEGIAAARDALRRLRRADPETEAVLADLAAAGDLVVIYDPAFPYPALSRVTLAAFLPGAAPPDGGARRFLVVVGRHALKRTPLELATVLAHEITGHAGQALAGDIVGGARVLDLECEASLHEARARIALGIDHDGGPAPAAAIAFRKALEGRWCRDFRSWQARARPATMALWQDRLLPADRLLSLFADYEAARN